MDTTLFELSPWRAALLALVPLLYVGAAVAACGMRPAIGWRLMRAGAALAVAAALLSLGWLLVEGAAVGLRGPTGALHFSLRSDALGGLMLLLVSFIGWVIVGFSRTCLDGEPEQPRYLRGLGLTLASVTLLVITNNLLVLALAWTATSLALHGLLTIFRTRPQALIAAHKKFLASRVADLCLLAAVALIHHQLGTLEIDRATAAARALPQLPAALQAAALLLAASALLKCAQLPVHGWLIQVMEAPTPVSALLHAGVVNLGGFVLIRVGALVADVPAAQALLVVVGSLTAVVAALVAMTRISIKVALAWSTCAQMGFMLMQCGLGLHELALLHLVAHSLYKAHAFLAAGTAVEHNRLHQMTPAEPVPGLRAWLLGALAGLALVALAALAWGLTAAAAPGLWALMFILALALVPLLTGTARRAEGLWPLAGPAAAFALALAYFGLHAAFGHILGNASDVAPAGWALAGSVMVCFLALFVVQGTLRARPQGALARRLYPALFAGLYLDELFTRLTFRVWPARLPAPPAARTQSQTSTTGVATEI
ncbi:MAG: NADH-quinone oxidoreductase subunit L [Rubrivivax sp.]|nr:NADH-quinone oxidoreductase subunit L [Rubrivivax sp.]